MEQPRTMHMKPLSHHEAVSWGDTSIQGWTRGKGD